MSSERVRKKWPSSRSLRWRTRYLFDDEGIREYARVMKTIWKSDFNKNYIEKSYLILSFYLSLHFARKNSHWFLYFEYVFRQNKITISCNHYLMRYIEKIRTIHLYNRLTVYNTYEYLFSSPSKDIKLERYRHKTRISLFVKFTQNGFFCLYSWSN